MKLCSKCGLSSDSLQVLIEDGRELCPPCMGEFLAVLEQTCRTVLLSRGIDPDEVIRQSRESAR